VSLFRAQLVLEEQRRLYDVWLDAAKGQPLPTRQSFQPKDFAALLPWISMVDRVAGGALRVRVAGSQLRDVLAGEPGQRLLCASSGGGADSFERCLATGEPANGADFRSTGKDSGVMCLWLRLPLGQAGAVEAVIGLDVALTRVRVPDWALSRMAV
jgi:hypothetical protein